MTLRSLVVTPDAPCVVLHVFDIDAAPTDGVKPSVAGAFAALPVATVLGLRNARLERARARLSGLDMMQTGRSDDFEGWRRSAGPTARLFNALNQ